MDTTTLRVSRAKSEGETERTLIVEGFNKNTATTFLEMAIEGDEEENVIDKIELSADGYSAVVVLSTKMSECFQIQRMSAL